MRQLRAYTSDSDGLEVQLSTSIGMAPSSFSALSIDVLAPLAPPAAPLPVLGPAAALRSPGIPAACSVVVTMSSFSIADMSFRVDLYTRSGLSSTSHNRCSVNGGLLDP